MTDRLDAVAEGVIQKRPEVVGVILRPQPRRPIVPAAIGQPGGMKGPNLRPRRRLEAPVALVVAICFRRLVNRQAGVEVFNVVASHAVAEGAWVVIDLGDTERGHYCIVEGAGYFSAWDGDGDVVEDEHVRALTQ